MEFEKWSIKVALSLKNHFYARYALVIIDKSIGRTMPSVNWTFIEI